MEKIKCVLTTTRRERVDDVDWSHKIPPYRGYSSPSVSAASALNQRVSSIIQATEHRSTASGLTNRVGSQPSLPTSVEGIVTDDESLGLTEFLGGMMYRRLSPTHEAKTKATASANIHKRKPQKIRGKSLPHSISK